MEGDIRSEGKWVERQYTILFTSLFVSALVTLFGVLIGLNYAKDFRLDINFYSFIEILAVFIMLVVSIATYGRIYLFYGENRLAAKHEVRFERRFATSFLSAITTGFAGLFAVSLASVPHLHIASLAVLVGGFCLFDLATILSVEGAIHLQSEEEEEEEVIQNYVKYLRLLQSWCYKHNLPTFLGFAVLYIIVISFYYSPLAYKEGYYLIIKAFVSGAASFHMTFMGIHFGLENREFILAGKLE